MKYRYIKNYLGTLQLKVLSLVLLITAPFSVINAQGLVPECSYDAADSVDQCGFNHVLELISNLINFIFLLVIPLAAIIAVSAGFMIIFSGDNASLRQNAKKMAFNFLKGLVVIMAAWLIVATILRALGVSDAYSFLNL